MPMRFEQSNVAYDVIIIGAGVSGLAAAVAIGRSKHRVLVVSMPNRRNSTSNEVHNFPFGEGVSPQQLYENMEKELIKYSVDLRWGAVESVVISDHDQLITVNTALAAFSTKRLVLATGLEDHVPGWVPDDVWGTSVFTCPFCHAYEHDGETFVVVGKGIVAVETALLCVPHANSITAIISEPDAVVSKAADRLRELGGNVVEGAIASASKLESGALDLVTTDGKHFVADAVLLSQTKKPPIGVATQLGLQMTNQGVPESTIEGRTSHPLIWVAGNAAKPHYLLAESMGSGVRVGISLVKDIAFSGLG